MVFRDTARDGTTRLTGAKFLKDDADKLYLPKYQEFDSGWIYVGSGATNSPAFTNGQTPYGINHGAPRFRRIGDIVYMEGLVANLSATAFATIFNLPVGFRPDGDIIPVGFGNTGSEGHGVRVLANGNVQQGTGVTSWTSMVCQFPVAGAATPWHVIGDPGEPAFGAGWSNYGGGWQTARFMKIGDYVYLQGLVQRTTGTNITIFTLPAGYTNTNGTTHTPCACVSAMSGGDFGLNIAAQVNSRAAGSNTGYVSLSGIKIYVGAVNDPKWKQFRGGAEGWFAAASWYGAPWPKPAIRRDGKIIFMEGLANVSAATGTTIKLPLGYAPGQQLIVPVVNASSRRVDITPLNLDGAAGATQNTATGINGFTHSWVVSEVFEGDIQWS